MRHCSGVLCALLILAGCGTTVSVKMLRPAEVNIGRVENLAVLDFRFRGSWAYVQEEDEPQTLTDVAVDVLKKALEMEDERPAMPDPMRAYPGSEVSARVISALVANGHYKVLERSRISSIMAEHALSVSGAVDEKQAAKIGRLLGVEALMLGNGSYAVRDVGEGFKDTTKNKEGQVVKITDKYRLARKVDVEVTYRIVDMTTGQVVASRTNTNRNYRGKAGSARTGAVVVGRNLADAYQRLPDWEGIVSGLLNAVANRTVKQIAPHFVWRRMKIEGGKSPGMKAGKKYVERGMWDEAKGAWDQVLAGGSEKEIKDHVAATYNLGVYFEVGGDLDKAEQHFDTCFKKTGKSKYLDHKARVRRRRAELAELEKQMERDD